MKSDVKSVRLPLIALGAVTGLALAGAAQAAPATKCKQTLSANDHVIALNEIQNLMGKYSHWGHLRGEGTLAELFAMKTEGVSWRTPMGPAGIEEMKARFDRPAESLEGGQIHVHSMLTPVIEIAADGKTAKGVWDSFGPNISSGSDIGNWLWVKYGVDFTKEDGVWKIWHLQVYALFNTPFNQSITQSAWDRAHPGRPGSASGGPGGPPPGAAPGAAPGGAAPGGAAPGGAAPGGAAPGGAAPGGGQGANGPAMGGMNQNWKGPKEQWIYDGKTAPKGPKIPEPYCTFDPADSYGNI
ncbi:MAG TPA: nuclear transport factor 2 family protein [Steroidobacteraceae bacterium]|nr:nuclear transport factor 2 family protein [Steroidobacteraceae bacterium]